MDPALHLFFSEKVDELPRRFAVLGENQRPRRHAVEPMHPIETALVGKLIALRTLGRLYCSRCHDDNFFNFFVNCINI